MLLDTEPFRFEYPTNFPQPTSREINKGLGSEPDLKKIYVLKVDYLVEFIERFMTFGFVQSCSGCGMIC